jgi:hypothetical protein
VKDANGNEVERERRTTVNHAGSNVAPRGATKSKDSASPAYLKRAGVQTHPNDLRSHECLCYDRVATATQWQPDR